MIVLVVPVALVKVNVIVGVFYKMIKRKIFPIDWENSPLLFQTVNIMNSLNITININITLDENNYSLFVIINSQFSGIVVGIVHEINVDLLMDISLHQLNMSTI